MYSGSESDLSDLLKLTVGDISALKEKKYRAGTGGIQKSYRRLKDWEATANTKNMKKMAGGFDYKMAEVSQRRRQVYHKQQRYIK